MSDFDRHRRAEGRVWAEGYTQAELDAAQDKYDLIFPPDLVELFLERRPVRGWDWRSDESQIREMLRHPVEGLIFDVEENGLWWPEWGMRPASSDERASVVHSVVDQAPKLIPILSHRYIPAEPSEAGDPIFSIMQSDIIYYGADIKNYFDHEFHLGSVSSDRIKYIPFWSDCVERAYREPYYAYGADS